MYEAPDTQGRDEAIGSESGTGLPWPEGPRETQRETRETQRETRETQRETRETQQETRETQRFNY